MYYNGNNSTNPIEQPNGVKIMSTATLQHYTNTTDSMNKFSTERRAITPDNLTIKPINANGFNGYYISEYVSEDLLETVMQVIQRDC